MANQAVKVFVTTEGVISKDVKESISSTLIETDEKSPSKRLRNILYRYWEQDKKGYEDFELFYRNEMNTISEHFKNKLT